MLSSVVFSMPILILLVLPLSEIHEAMWFLVKRKVPSIEFVSNGYFSLKAKQFIESSWQQCSTLWTLLTM
jgi:hypothetical protein